MDGLNFKNRMLLMIISDFIFVFITSIVLIYYERLPIFIKIVINPFTMSLYLVIFVLIEQIKFAKFIKSSDVVLWNKVKEGIYPEFVKIKWVFFEKENQIPINIRKPKRDFRNLILISYAIFIINVPVLIMLYYFIGLVLVVD